MLYLPSIPGLSGTTVPTAINESGHVTGVANSGTPTTATAFLYRKGQIELLPGSNDTTTTVGLAINSCDQIVGYRDNSYYGGNTHAVLFTAGQMIDLNDRIPSNTGWVLEFAYGINDGGKIILPSRPTRYAAGKKEFQRLIAELKRLSPKNGYSQGQIASEVGVTRITVNHWWTGQSLMAQRGSIERLKEFLTAYA